MRFIIIKIPAGNGLYLYIAHGSDYSNSATNRNISVGSDAMYENKLDGNISTATLAEIITKRNTTRL